MKKFIFLLSTLLTASMFIGCSSDKGDNTETANYSTNSLPFEVRTVNGKIVFLDDHQNVVTGWTPCNSGTLASGAKWEIYSDGRGKFVKVVNSLQPFPIHFPDRNYGSNWEGDIANGHYYYWETSWVSDCNPPSNREIGSSDPLLILDDRTPGKLLEIDASGALVTTEWTIICNNGRTPATHQSGVFCASDGKGHYALVNWQMAPPMANTCSGHAYSGGYVRSSNSGGIGITMTVYYCSRSTSRCEAC